LYAQALQAHGIDTQVRELSSREVVEPALEAGDVGLVPEYLGTVTEFLNKKVNGASAAALASGDSGATSQALTTLAGPLGLTAFTPSPAADQNAFAVSLAFAKEHGVRTVSDLSAYSQHNPLILGGPPECPTRPFCEPGLTGVYGMRLSSFIALDSGGPLTKQSLTQGKIDVGLVFSSDGGLGVQGLVVLDDDKHLQTADNLVPLISSSIASPQVRAILDAVSAVLTTDLLVSLNKQVDIDRMDPAAVAKAFLLAHGVI
jgi:osmoprotectant transport system substrate-binding protein